MDKQANKDVTNFYLNECTDPTRKALLLENFTWYSEARKLQYNELFPWDERR